MEFVVLILLAVAAGAALGGEDFMKAVLTVVWGLMALATVGSILWAIAVQARHWLR